MLNIEKLFKDYPDLSREFIVKVEALRRGVNLTPEACEKANRAYSKTYFIFAQDRSESKDLNTRPHFFIIPPDSSCQLRYDPQSPYSIEIIENEFVFCENHKPVLKVDIPPAHKLYQTTLKDGTPLKQVMGILVGDGAFACVLDGCYWKNELYCGYCDTVPHLIEHKKQNPNYIFHKKPEQIAEAYEMCWDAGLTHMNITGGAIPDRYQGKTDAEFYIEYLEAISSRRKFPQNFGIAFIAKTWDELKRIHATGIKIVAMNLEVWEPGLFAKICPGKDRVIGRDRWIQSLIDAVDIFGEGNVVTNFVAGVEMCQPYGFKDVDAALKSTLTGYKFLIQRGIVPRQDYWCIEENTRLGTQQVAPPSEFFIRLTTACYELLKKYNLPRSPFFCRKCNEIDPIHDL